MENYLVELSKLVGEEEDEPFLLISLLMHKESGFGVCIVMEELTQGDKEEQNFNGENIGESEIGEAKSNDLANELIHFGFHNQPTIIPKKNTNNIGLINIVA